MNMRGQTPVQYAPRIDNNGIRSTLEIWRTAPVHQKEKSWFRGLSLALRIAAAGYE
jgi:hypothetical protein